MLKLIDFLNKTFGINNDTAANILVTIFTFSFGIIITIIFTAIKEYRERLRYRKLIRINLKNLIKGIYRQANAYTLLTKQMSMVHVGSFVFSPRSISAVGILNQLGYSNFHNAFFNGIENITFGNGNKRIMAFNKVWATIEFLNVFHQESFKEVQKFLSTNSEMNELRNSSLGKAYQITESIRIALHGREIPVNLGRYFMRIEEIYLNLTAQENYTNPQITNDFFVEPLLELNRSNIDVITEFKDILNPVELNLALLETALRYTNQKNHMETTQVYFKEFADSFYKNSNAITGAYRTLF